MGYFATETHMGSGGGCWIIKFWTVSTSWVHMRSTSSLEMCRQSDYVGTAIDQTISYCRKISCSINHLSLMNCLFSASVVLEKSMASFRIDNLAPSLPFSHPPCFCLIVSNCGYHAPLRTFLVLDSISFCIIRC